MDHRIEEKLYHAMYMAFLLSLDSLFPLLDLPFHLIVLLINSYFYFRIKQSFLSFLISLGSSKGLN